MSALTFRPQLQQQHQEAPDAAPANLDPTQGPVPDGAGDDDIINDILGDKPPREERRDKREKRPERERPEPVEDTEPEPDEVEVQEEEEPEDPVPDDDEDLEDEELPEAAERDEEEAPRGSTAAARAALKAGDLDKAFMLAFGKKPEEVVPNSHAWTKWRQANDREEQKRTIERRQLDGERVQFQQAAQAERLKLHQTIEALKPYEKFCVAEQAWHRDGDPGALVEIIQGITRMTYDEAQKVILTKTKRSPAEREMARKLRELETKLQETAQEREQREQQQSQAQVYQNDLNYIRQNVSGPITKLPKFAERIYNVLAKTRNAAGLTLTVEQAAKRVIRAEQRRVENHPFVRRKVKAGAVAASDAGRTLREQRRTSQTRTPLRRDSQNNGAPNKETETDDDIIADILSNRRRAG